MNPEVRRVLLVGTIAVLAAVGLAWWGAPDTGDVPPPPQPSSPVSVGQQTSVPGGAPAAQPVIPQPDLGRLGAVQRPLPRGPEPAPPAPIDPNEVLSADHQGVALAALQRRDQLIACWDEHRPPDATRLTLRFTVSDAGDGAGAVAVDVPAIPTALGLHACLNDTFADARFVSPGDMTQTVMWPVPLPP